MPWITVLFGIVVLTAHIIKAILFSRVVLCLSSSHLLSSIALSGVAYQTKHRTSVRVSDAFNSFVFFLCNLSFVCFVSTYIDDIQSTGIVIQYYITGRQKYFSYNVDVVTRFRISESQPIGCMSFRINIEFVVVASFIPWLDFSFQHQLRGKFEFEYTYWTNELH